MDLAVGREWREISRELGKPGESLPASSNDKGESFYLIQLCCCHNKILQTEWLKQQKLCSHNSGG